MPELCRRRLLTGVPLLTLWASSARAQPRSEMASSDAGDGQGEVQVGAGTQADVTTGSSGPQKKKGAGDSGSARQGDSRANGAPARPARQPAAASGARQ